jgi:hypothetical protein
VEEEIDGIGAVEGDEEVDCGGIAEDGEGFDGRTYDLGVAG